MFCQHFLGGGGGAGGTLSVLMEFVVAVWFLLSFSSAEGGLFLE